MQQPETPEDCFDPSNLTSRGFHCLIRKFTNEELQLMSPIQKEGERRLSVGLVSEANNSLPVNSSHGNNLNLNTDSPYENFYRKTTQPSSTDISYVAKKCYFKDLAEQTTDRNDGSEAQTPPQNETITIDTESHSVKNNHFSKQSQTCAPSPAAPDSRNNSEINDSTSSTIIGSSPSSLSEPAIAEGNSNRTRENADVSLCQQASTLSSSLDASNKENTLQSTLGRNDYPLSDVVDAVVDELLFLVEANVIDYQLLSEKHPQNQPITNNHVKPTTFNETIKDDQEQGFDFSFSATSNPTDGQPGDDTPFSSKYQEWDSQKDTFVIENIDCFSSESEELDEDDLGAYVVVDEYTNELEFKERPLTPTTSEQTKREETNALELVAGIETTVEEGKAFKFSSSELPRQISTKITVNECHVLLRKSKTTELATTGEIDANNNQEMDSTSSHEKSDISAPLDIDKGTQKPKDNQENEDFVLYSNDQQLQNGDGLNGEATENGHNSVSKDTTKLKADNKTAIVQPTKTVLPQVDVETLNALTLIMDQISRLQIDIKTLGEDLPPAISALKPVNNINSKLTGSLQKENTSSISLAVDQRTQETEHNKKYEVSRSLIPSSNKITQFELRNKIDNKFEHGEEKVLPLASDVLKNEMPISPIEENGEARSLINGRAESTDDKKNSDATSSGIFLSAMDQQLDNLTFPNYNAQIGDVSFSDLLEYVSTNDNSGNPEDGFVETEHSADVFANDSNESFDSSVPIEDIEFYLQSIEEPNYISGEEIVKNVTNRLSCSSYENMEIGIPFSDNSQKHHKDNHDGFVKLNEDRENGSDEQCTERVDIQLAENHSLSVQDELEVETTDKKGCTTFLDNNQASSSHESVQKENENETMFFSQSALFVDEYEDCDASKMFLNHLDKQLIKEDNVFHDVAPVLFFDTLDTVPEVEIPCNMNEDGEEQCNPNNLITETLTLSQVGCPSLQIISDVTSEENIEQFPTMSHRTRDSTIKISNREIRNASAFPACVTNRQADKTGRKRKSRNRTNGPIRKRKNCNPIYSTTDAKSPTIICREEVLTSHAKLNIPQQYDPISDDDLLQDDVSNKPVNSERFMPPDEVFVINQNNKNASSKKNTRFVNDGQCDTDLEQLSGTSFIESGVTYSSFPKEVFTGVLLDRDGFKPDVNKSGGTFSSEPQSDKWLSQSPGIKNGSDFEKYNTETLATNSKEEKNNFQQSEARHTTFIEAKKAKCTKNENTEKQWYENNNPEPDKQRKSKDSKEDKNDKHKKQKQKKHTRPKRKNQGHLEDEPNRKVKKYDKSTDRKGKSTNEQITEKVDECTPNVLENENLTLSTGRDNCDSVSNKHQSNSEYNRTIRRKKLKRSLPDAKVAENKRVKTSGNPNIENKDNSTKLQSKVKSDRNSEEHCENVSINQKLNYKDSYDGKNSKTSNDDTKLPTFTKRKSGTAQPAPERTFSRYSNFSSTYPQSSNSLENSKPLIMTNKGITEQNDDTCNNHEKSNDIPKVTGCVKEQPACNDSDNDTQRTKATGKNEVRNSEHVSSDGCPFSSSNSATNDKSRKSNSDVGETSKHDDADPDKYIILTIEVEKTDKPHSDEGHNSAQRNRDAIRKIPYGNITLATLYNFYNDDLDDWSIPKPRRARQH